MSSNPHHWLIEFARAECLSVVPGIDGEPWLPYQAIALLTQETERTIADKAQKFKLPRHPAYPGHIKFTDFERYGDSKAAELTPEDILPGDPATTLWRLCAANGWVYVPDLNGGEPFIDLECLAHLLGVTKKTLQTDYMDGVPKYANGLVRISEVMRQKRDSK